MRFTWKDGFFSFSSLAICGVGALLPTKPLWAWVLIFTGVAGMIFALVRAAFRGGQIKHTHNLNDLSLDKLDNGGTDEEKYTTI